MSTDVHAQRGDRVKTHREDGHPPAKERGPSLMASEGTHPGGIFFFFNILLFVFFF